MIDKIKDTNPIFHMINEYPWLGEIAHDFGDFSLHVEGLDKRFNQKILKQSIITELYFKPEIFEKYKDKFMRSIPIASGQNLIHNFVFQINYDLIVTFMIGKISKDDNVVLLADFFSTTLKKAHDFVVENLEFAVENNKPTSLGFGGR